MKKNIEKSKELNHMLDHIEDIRRFSEGVGNDILKPLVEEFEKTPCYRTMDSLSDGVYNRAEEQFMNKQHSYVNIKEFTMEKYGDVISKIVENEIERSREMER